MLFISLGSALLFMVAGCSEQKMEKSNSAVVNTKCPMMGGKVDPKKVPEKLVRKFKDQAVGFCCAGCPEKWDKLSDEDKAKKLAIATGKSSSKTPTPSARSGDKPVFRSGGGCGGCGGV